MSNLSDKDDYFYVTEEINLTQIKKVKLGNMAGLDSEKLVHQIMTQNKGKKAAALKELSPHLEHLSNIQINHIKVNTTDEKSDSNIRPSKEEAKESIKKK